MTTLTAEEMVTRIRYLREKSGEGLVACRLALVAHSWEVESAPEHLRCDGQAVVRRAGSLKPCGCPVKHTGS